MRITLTLMIVLFTFGCTSTAIQPPIAAGTEVRMAIDVSQTPTTDRLLSRSTERVATIFALQTASATPLPTHPPTETLAPTATRMPTSTSTPLLLSRQGPWLAYLRYGLSIVNQDGTGKTILEDPACMGGGIQENPLNRLVIFPGAVYLVQPEATWKLIYREWPPCGTDFTGDEKGGFLASIYLTAPDSLPELRIYELPSGKIHDQFPLMNCSEQCNTDNVHWWEIKWSPNGRYLAFPAMLDGPSSDLYVYDIQNGNIRRLTTGPDDVGTIWWSPDGSQIIMGEIHENYYPYTSSLWVVSLSSGDVRLLYSLDENPYPKGLLGWLDDKRFIGYYGTTLADALDLPASNLSVVDISSGEVTTLFNGSFMAAILDAPHETVAFLTYDEEPKEGFVGAGLYLVSASQPQLRHLEGGNFLTWNADRALFVTDIPCEDNTAGRKAFNYREEWQCVYPRIQPESLSSPDGTWQVSLEDGFWLERSNHEAIQISKQTPTQIIWRKDSGGLFFIENLILYYTPLPKLNVTIVDKYPGGDSIIYQWVGGS
jgi:WD40 repeat protein